MDPQATIRDLVDAVSEHDWDRVDELAAALLTWMGKGGFPPVLIGQESLGKGWHLAVANFIARLAQAKVRHARRRKRKPGA